MKNNKALASCFWLKVFGGLILGLCFSLAGRPAAANTIITLTSLENFFEACRAGTAAEVEDALTERGYLRRYDSSEYTGLMWAVFYNPDPKVIQFLLEAGAPVNAVNRHSQTALLMAAEYGKDPELVKLLVTQRARVEVRDHGALL